MSPLSPVSRMVVVTVLRMVSAVSTGFNVDVGLGDGYLVGRGVGSLGRLVGSSVCPVGCSVGILVGPLVGVSGTAVGSLEGIFVGEIGVDVGSLDGI